MVEEKQETSNKNKVIMISVASGLGTLLLGFLIWSAITASNFVTFSEDEYHVKINYPNSWTVAKGYAGTIVTFISPKEDALDSFQESLNISVNDLSKNPMSLDQYSEMAIKQMNAVFKTNIQTIDSKPITFAGYPGYLYSVKSTSNEGVAFKFVWFIKGNQAYTITCAAQIIRAEKYTATFDEMLRSFSILAL